MSGPFLLLTVKIDLLTLFPEMIRGFLSESIVGRALSEKLLEVEVHNLRDWATGKQKIVDDRAVVGGAVMFLKPEPIFSAVEELRKEETTTIYFAPDGEPFSAELAREFAEKPHLLLLSGHYEGVDQRVRDTLIDREISIGAYVLTNGTLAAAGFIDACARYMRGVLGDEKSLTQDSCQNDLLSRRRFTRPAQF